MKRPDLIRKHTRILEEKGLLVRRGERAADLPAVTAPRRCVVCGTELPPHLARVCSGECFQLKPD